MMMNVHPTNHAIEQERKDPPSPILTCLAVPVLPTRARFTQQTAATRRSLRVLCAAAVVLTAGCDRAPSYSILGSFFPVWLLCFLIGMLLTFGVHVLLQRLRLAGLLSPAVLVYPSLTALFTMALWLIFYS